MEKLIDMQLPKQKKSEMKDTLAVPGNERDRWPWGLQVRLEKEQIDKLPGVEKFKVGDSVSVNGVGTVTAVRMSERAQGKPDHTIEIQIEKIAVNSGKNTKPENMSMKSYRKMREG